MESQRISCAQSRTSSVSQNRQSNVAGAVCSPHSRHLLLGRAWRGVFTRLMAFVGMWVHTGGCCSADSMAGGVTLSCRPPSRPLRDTACSCRSLPCVAGTCSLLTLVWRLLDFPLLDGELLGLTGQCGQEQKQGTLSFPEARASPDNQCEASIFIF